jgi:hypothetical protein
LKETSSAKAHLIYAAIVLHANSNHKEQNAGRAQEFVMSQKHAPAQAQHALTMQNSHEALHVMTACIAMGLRLATIPGIVFRRRL